VNAAADATNDGGGRNNRVPAPGTNQAVETAGALPQGHRGTRGDPFMTAG